MKNVTAHIPTLDFNHLNAQTLGDQALERQLLTLFRVQATEIVSGLQKDSFASAGVNADFAHLLKGSALAIGATRVAAMAAAYESLVGAHNQRSAAIALASLAEAVADAVGLINQHLDPA